MLQTLKECSQLWEQLLCASGGALELSKCYLQLLHWHLKNLDIHKLHNYSKTKMIWFQQRMKSNWDELCGKHFLRSRPSLYHNRMQIIRIQHQIFRDDVEPKGHMGGWGYENSKQKQWSCHQDHGKQVEERRLKPSTQSNMGGTNDIAGKYSKKASRASLGKLGFNQKISKALGYGWSTISGLKLETSFINGRYCNRWQQNAKGRNTWM